MSGPRCEDEALLCAEIEQTCLLRADAGDKSYQRDLKQRKKKKKKKRI